MMDMLAATQQRKSVPWLFYGQTTSLCETCWELVPAKIIGEEGRVYLQKRCAEHGVMKTLIEEDADYWLSTKRWLKPGDRPLFNATHTEHNCPWDCGLCPDHEQHSCLAIGGGGGAGGRAGPGGGAGGAGGK